MSRLEEVTSKPKLDFKFEGKVITLFNSKGNILKEEELSEMSEIHFPHLGFHTKTQGNTRFPFYGEFPVESMGHFMKYSKSGCENVGDGIRQELIDVDLDNKPYIGRLKNPTWNQYLDEDIIKLIKDGFHTMEHTSTALFKRCYSGLRSVLHL